MADTTIKDVIIKIAIESSMSAATEGLKAITQGGVDAAKQMKALADELERIQKLQQNMGQGNNFGGGGSGIGGGTGGGGFGGLSGGSGGGGSEAEWMEDMRIRMAVQKTNREKLANALRGRSWRRAPTVKMKILRW